MIDNVFTFLTSRNSPDMGNVNSFVAPLIQFIPPFKPPLSMKFESILQNYIEHLNCVYEKL